MDPLRRVAKRSRLEAESESKPRAEILVVHTVVCDQSKLHQHHPAEEAYLDIPRLFEGDSKASHLRGQIPVSNVEELLEEHQDVMLIVYREYSCNQYHDEVEGQFSTLRCPKHPTSPSILPYFFYFRGDGKEAQMQNERMEIVAEELKLRLHKLTGMSLEALGQLGDDINQQMLYHAFYHYRNNPQYIQERPLHGQDHACVAAFRAFMESTFGSEYDEADVLFEKGRVTSKHVGKLFGPNEVVVTHQEGEPIGLCVNGYRTSASGLGLVRCHSWAFDGGFYRRNWEIQVEWPDSEYDIGIEDLNIYPLRFNTTGLETRLKTRGQTFWGCRQSRYIAYNPPHQTFQFQTTKPRYMVDVRTYQQIHSKSDPVQHKNLGPDVTEEEMPEDPFVFLLPATVRGFGFYDKKWQTLLVEHIAEITWNINAFNHLVLSATKKQLIEALIASHTGSSVATDVIEGKGNGLILLLHGGPGTGKTLTAESVAELTRRPLYRVTCGDIGTNAEDVESYLETVFYLGTKWNCVVLLDEADIFLEERTPTDLHRNAMVSVFLRVLEYYEGILILTSNRIGTFDEAFKSRVHLTLHYPRLDKSGRRQIWSNFINGLQQANVHARIDELRDKIDKLSGKALNGREIRNAIKSATLLAQFRHERLGYKHLAEVIKMTSEFEKYLTEVHGHSSSEWVKAQGTRAD